MSLKGVEHTTHLDVQPRQAVEAAAGICSGEDGGRVVNSQHAYCPPAHVLCYLKHRFHMII